MCVHPLPGSPYTALDVSAFDRVSLRPNGSPTEAVLQDFIVQGLTVDDLYTMLHGIGHKEGMKTLQEFGMGSYTQIIIISRMVPHMLAALQVCRWEYFTPDPTQPEG